MALGVTQQLPLEERHIYKREYIEDSLVVRMGGRVAELLVYGDLSTGASDDLQRNTELARKMVREWGMSDRVGPMAWGAQGRCSSARTSCTPATTPTTRAGSSTRRSRSILRDQEARARKVLEEHRSGLDRGGEGGARAARRSTAREVARLVDEAYGRPVHGEEPEIPHFAGSIFSSSPTTLPATARAGAESVNGAADAAGALPPAQPMGMAAGLDNPRAPRDRLA